MPQYRGLVRTLHKTVTVTSVSVTGLRSSRTRANKLVSIVSRFFWLVLSNLISLSRSWERKSKKHLSLHSSLDCSRERWVSHRGRSLRSKRFSVVSEQKQNEERRRNWVFGFGCAKSGTRAKKWNGGRGSFLPFFPTPPRSFTRHIFRAVFWHSFLVLCSETARKRLLRRLPGSGLEGISLWIWRFSRVWFLTYY